MQPVIDERTFAHALEAIDDDFARIRGIANAGKHLDLRHRRPVTNAPINAANTYSQSLSYGEGGSGQGPFGGGEFVVLEGASDMPFLEIAQNVRGMWLGLKTTHGW